MTVHDLAARLPDIDLLRRRGMALAVLERLIDSDFPHYGYASAWGPHEAASMDNGSGDEWAVVFTTEGAFIRVFDHESPLSPYRNSDRELWPGLLDGLPAAFEGQVREPAFGDEDGRFVATAVLWRLAGDDRWHAGDGIEFPPPRARHGDGEVDGSGMLEILLDDIVEQFVEFAADYYEITLDPAAVAHVVAHRPLTDAVVRAVNPRLTVADVHRDVTAMGYPVAAS
ncbi:hypothetical protein [Micromonospora auratinigra]|uniref:Uncharacterized protein n=1 Tax=Micromonospora auratinigra TaxID=261654 RepID=A0A1A8ZAB3_9ACTN|nr:hypothetical protein [Micromonospora auratinigra]SBT40908.1 hypothetical protein GA0070611_1430 [Micromonospora auratinigra]